MKRPNPFVTILTYSTLIAFTAPALAQDASGNKASAPAPASCAGLNKVGKADYQSLNKKRKEQPLCGEKKEAGKKLDAIQKQMAACERLGIKTGQFMNSLKQNAEKTCQGFNDYVKNAETVCQSYGETAAKTNKVGKDDEYAKHNGTQAGDFKKLKETHSGLAEEYRDVLKGQNKIGADKANRGDKANDGVKQDVKTVLGMIQMKLNNLIAQANAGSLQKRQGVASGGGMDLSGTKPIRFKDDAEYQKFQKEVEACKNAGQALKDFNLKEFQPKVGAVTGDMKKEAATLDEQFEKQAKAHSDYADEAAKNEKTFNDMDAETAKAEAKNKVDDEAKAKKEAREKSMEQSPWHKDYKARTGGRSWNEDAPPPKTVEQERNDKALKEGEQVEYYAKQNGKTSGSAATKEANSLAVNYYRWKPDGQVNVQGQTYNKYIKPDGRIMYLKPAPGL